MRPVLTRLWAVLALLSITVPSLAASPVPVVIGPSRDGSLHSLQRKVDRFLGIGRLNVRTDRVGALAKDPDPWTWDNPGRAIEITLVDAKSPHARIGWYAECGGSPVLDGVEDAVVLHCSPLRPGSRGFRLPSSVTRFGFFVTHQPEGAGAMGEASAIAGPVQDLESAIFSNRFCNDPGPLGAGAAHAPHDGDVQMLVYDVSRWLGPQTWLVACETSDSGRPVGHGVEESDNDYSDVVFLVSGVSTTPTAGTSFGRLKSRFR